MSQYLLFGDKLHRKIGDMLKNAGFELTSRYVEPADSLTYERKNISFKGVDRINFHGEEDNHNYIYSTVVSAKGGLAFIPVLKILTDNFETLDYPDNSRWSYNDEVELDRVLDEIAVVVRDKLLKWFENPSDAKAAQIPNNTLGDWNERLAENAKLYEEFAKRLRAEGKIAEAQKYEDVARLYHKQISK